RTAPPPRPACSSAISSSLSAATRCARPRGCERASPIAWGSPLRSVCCVAATPPTFGSPPQSAGNTHRAGNDGLHRGAHRSPARAQDRPETLRTPRKNETMASNNHIRPTTFPLLPLRRGVLLPGTTLSVPIGRRRSVSLVESLHVGDVFGVVVQRDLATEESVLADVHEVGTYARVEKISRARDGRSFRIVLEGLERFELQEIEQSDPYWFGRGDPAPDRGGGDEAEVLAGEIRSHLRRAVGNQHPTLSEIIESTRDPGLLADRVVSALDVDRDREVQILLTLDVATRLRLT